MESAIEINLTSKSRLWKDLKAQNNGSLQLSSPDMDHVNWSECCIEIASVDMTKCDLYPYFTGEMEQGKLPGLEVSEQKNYYKVQRPGRTHPQPRTHI